MPPADSCRLSNRRYSMKMDTALIAPARVNTHTATAISVKELGIFKPLRVTLPVLLVRKRPSGAK